MTAGVRLRLPAGGSWQDIRSPLSEFFCASLTGTARKIRIRGSANALPPAN